MKTPGRNDHRLAENEVWRKIDYLTIWFSVTDYVNPGHEDDDYIHQQSLTQIHCLLP